MTNHRISTVGLFMAMFLAARMTGCGSDSSPTTGSASGTSGASTGTGDPNPSTMCPEPGKGQGGDPCLSACDCCAGDCRVLTDLDGGKKGVCGTDCTMGAGTVTKD